jgi:Xaa-Pro aminopeptidase
MNKLSPQFFAANRKRLSNKLGKKGTIVIAGNALVKRSGDTNYPFRQDSNFYYLTGISEPSAFLVIDLETNFSYVAMQIREGMHSVFDGKQDLSNLLLESGVDEIIGFDKGWGRLKEQTHEELYSITPNGSGHEENNVNCFHLKIYSDLKKITDTPIKDISSDIASLRVIKTPEEIRMIEKAVTITNKALSEVEAMISNFGNEKEIEAEITKRFMIEGAQGHAYQPIIASGLASCTLHYIDNNQPLSKNSPLLLDVGAEFSNYAADISRTFVIGKIDPKQNEILEGVKKIQKDLIAALKPGMYFSEIARMAHDKIADLLVNTGLINTNHTKEDVYKYFPHSVSHFLGLDVHDVGDYTSPLAENMVITIEPGIYWHEMGFGVRIEDDVLITKDGARIIGNNVND